MRVFALSDLHIDYDVNAMWVAGISRTDYQSDLLICAGDVSSSLKRFAWCMEQLARRFFRVLYVPGNHDLWSVSCHEKGNSLEKFRQICDLARESGASSQSFTCRRLSVVPLLSWYDYSFGDPSPELNMIWADYYRCRWPANLDPRALTRFFLGYNEEVLQTKNETVISFSHFLPRTDALPAALFSRNRFLLPVLGSSSLEEQIRRLKPKVHVYGHSHINTSISLGSILYINNAYGYPSEALTTTKTLRCIHDESEYPSTGLRI